MTARHRSWSALALTALVAAGAVPAHAATSTIEARDNVFAPTSQTVSVGDRVTWRNTGQAPHEVTASGGQFRSGNIAKGASYTWTADRAGSFTYYCSYHGTATTGMTATLVVRAATTGSTVGSGNGTTGLPKTGGGREVALGLLVLAGTAVVGLGLRAARSTR